MSGLDHLLELQALDLAVDQAQKRRQRLPEQEAFDLARSERDSVVMTIARLERELASAEGTLTTVEASTADIDVKVTKLKGQLRNVIAIREVEALQSEIAQLAQRRSDLDDEGLAELERAELVGVELDTTRGRLPVVEATLATAAATLADADAAVNADITEWTAARPGKVDQVPAALLARYVSLRKVHGGVVVARLNGSRCEACHLDLSRVEVEALRHTPADEPAECPSCGRLLVC